MRPVDVSGIKIKVFLEWDKLATTVDDEVIVEVVSMTEKGLFFNNSINQMQFENLSNINVYFYVSGNWKCYSIQRFGPHKKSYQEIVGLNFEFDKKKQEEFYQDYTFAR